MLAKCCFRSGNIAIKDAHKASWMCFYAGHCNIIRTAWNTEDRKFSLRENAAIEKFGENGINLRLHSLRPFTLSRFFAFYFPKRRSF